MMGSHGLGHQLHAQTPDRSAMTPCPKPLLGLLFCGLPLRISLYSCSSMSTFQDRGQFLPLAWGPQQVTSDTWKGLGPTPSTLSESWSLWQGPGWEQLWC